jgi:hypothetical protein
MKQVTVMALLLGAGSAEPGQAEDTAIAAIVASISRRLIEVTWLAPAIEA